MAQDSRITRAQEFRKFEISKDEASFLIMASLEVQNGIDDKTDPRHEMINSLLVRLRLFYQTRASLEQKPRTLTR
jgi:hypothetical protein